MRVERLMIMLLGGVLVWALWKVYRGKLHKMWQRVKDQRPRQWRPKSPEDCPRCQAEIEVIAVPSQPEVTPYRARKSSRGRKKTIPTQGFACPYETCEYVGVQDDQGMRSGGRMGEVLRLASG